MTTIKNWEKEFDEKFDEVFVDYPYGVQFEDIEIKEDIKQFISKLLSQQRKEFVKTHKELFDCKLK